MMIDALIRSLDFIEKNIESDIHVKDIADYSYVSLSSLQKTFRYVFGISIHEYIIRRRSSLAARDLLKTDSSILEISLKYGYSNAESFTRSFRKIWVINPREFRKSRKFTGHTPRFLLPNTDEFHKGSDVSRIRYDLSELSDVIQYRKNNAYVCADLNGLSMINNNFGFSAGDAALLELMRRLENACKKSDMILRIGGDEFVIFTDSVEMTHANEIVEKVAEMNEQPITSGERTFPVSIHIGAFKTACRKNAALEERYAEISGDFENIHQKEENPCGKI